MDRYCLGCQYFETRAATEEEKQHVAAREAKVGKAYRGFLWTLRICGISFLLGLVSLIFIEGYGFLVMLLAFCISMPTLYMYSHERKRYRHLHGSVPLEQVDVYGDPALAAIGGYINPDINIEPQAASVAIHPVTGLIVKSGLQLENRILKVGVQRVVAAPTSRGKRGLFPEMKHHLSQDMLPMRSLSPAELWELTTLNNELFSRPRVLDILFCIWILGRVLQFASRQVLIVWLAVIAPVILIYIVYQRWRPYFDIKKDISRGIVVQLDQNGEDIEVLPNSSMIWTVEGNPAGLRTDGSTLIEY